MIRDGTMQYMEHISRSREPFSSAKTKLGHKEFRFNPYDPQTGMRSETPESNPTILQNAAHSRR